MDNDNESILMTSSGNFFKFKNAHYGNSFVFVIVTLVLSQRYVRSWSG
jgi:hypothetical protein